MKALALVTDAFGGHGGIALYNRDILKAICAHEEIDEVIAIPRCANNSLEEMPSNLTYDLAGVQGGFSYIKTVAKHVFSDKHPDFILCCHINLMPLAWLIGKIRQIPVILEIYGIEAWQPRGKRIAEYLSSKAATVISISNYTRVKYLSWSQFNEDKCVLLPNAIHASLYGMSEKPLYLVSRYGVENKKVLLTLGRIVSKERAKGFDEVLEVMPELLKVRPGIVYIIAGEGEYAPALKEKVENLKLENHVIFTGMIAENEKADLYRLADVYVMPSRGEGFGFVFLEALACGTPVIASEADGSREAVLDGELGIVVDPDEPEQLKNAILDALRLPKKIPEKLDYFSFKNFTLRLHAIIDDTLKVSKA